MAQDSGSAFDVKEASGEVSGMNTTLGPTGLINIPTAFTARLGEFRVGGTWGGSLRGPSVNYGLVRWIEIGAAGLDRDGGSDKFIASGKVMLTPGNFNWLTVGIGVIDPFDAIDETIYLVGSVDLIPPRVSVAGESAMPVGLRAHLGGGTGMFKDDLFAGAELLFGNNLAIIGEWDATNVNGAVRYKTATNLQLQAGFREKRIFFGITNSFRF